MSVDSTTLRHWVAVPVFLIALTANVSANLLEDEQPRQYPEVSNPFALIVAVILMILVFLAFLLLCCWVLVILSAVLCFGTMGQTPKTPRLTCPVLV